MQMNKIISFAPTVFGTVAQWTHEEKSYVGNVIGYAIVEDLHRDTFMRPVFEGQEITHVGHRNYSSDESYRCWQFTEAAEYIHKNNGLFLGTIAELVVKLGEAA